MNPQLRAEDVAANSLRDFSARIAMTDSLAGRLDMDRNGVTPPSETNNHAIDGTFLIERAKRQRFRQLAAG